MARYLVHFKSCNTTKTTNDDTHAKRARIFYTLYVRRQIICKQTLRVQSFRHNGNHRSHTAAHKTRDTMEMQRKTDDRRQQTDETALHVSQTIVFCRTQNACTGCRHTHTHTHVQNSQNVTRHLHTQRATVSVHAQRSSECIFCHEQLHKISAHVSVIHRPQNRPNVHQSPVQPPLPDNHYVPHVQWEGNLFGWKSGSGLAAEDRWRILCL